MPRKGYIEYVSTIYRPNKFPTIASLLKTLVLTCFQNQIPRKAENVRRESADDVQKMFQFFEEMKSENDNFYYDVHVDEDKRIKNIFWANASCRAAYADFGDCVTFDTTYKSNKYHMPLAVYFGVNNHLQSSIFGVALIVDKMVDSFKWVYSIFLRCMKGKQPICILTGISKK